MAHVINLIVQDGLKEIGDSVRYVRLDVRYIRQGSKDLKMLLLEYLLIYVCEDGKTAGALTSDDWANVRRMEKFLETFYNLTLRVSGSLYVTSNVHFHEIGELYCVLKLLIEGDDINLSLMARRMKAKFDKYWGAPEKMNKMIFVSCVLDPRFKFDYVAFVILRMYEQEKGEKMIDEVKTYMACLFDEYRKITSKACGVSSDSHCNTLDLSGINFGSIHKGTLIQQEYLRHKAKSGSMDAKTELDRYLGEENEVENEQFAILLWWKMNEPRFPTLAEMARNVLAIPISTVASESAFNIGGRVLDSFRSSLTHKLVQALICVKDWLQIESSPFKVEEDLDYLE
ncbi:zinc finger BED domain-containing protein RICESLEEPER 2-like [Primulina tabacum]|uniref:zinc finger BED domain-containing protein RICESLEEPER 2-like n=1 Tax=Primulina tabacum TaxID=48773 RepID=UPI003F5961AE